jgi:site-specific recombinase XerD
MLNIYRRHIRKCPNDTRDAQKCRCPIWCDWVTDTRGGRRVRFQQSLGLRDWQAAQLRARDMEADGVDSYLAGDHSALTVQKAIDDFEADAKNNIQASTLKQYKIILAKLSAYCKGRGIVFLKQLGVVEVREFRNSWTTYSPRTAGKHIERLKRFFSWCVENGWLETSPAKPLKSPKVGETDVIPFTEEEVGKILKACDEYQGGNQQRLVILTKLMLATGLAIGDATMLSKSKVGKNGSGYNVELRRAKTGAVVSCPIPNGLAKPFLALDGDTPFWTGKSDLEHLTANWRKIYTKIFEAAGIEDGHPHRFRHTCAKRLLVKGIPIGFVASVLGDSEEIVRKHYSKWIPERQAALEQAIRGSWGA